MSLFRLLPLSYLSWFIGILANIPLPQPLARWTVLLFARSYGIDVTNATKELGKFRCIGDFFTRDLRSELRPIGEGFVCPVDGTLRSYHELSAGTNIPQIKGKSYTLHELLAGDPLVSRLERGSLWNMYLSPSDAHHIHAPVTGAIIRTVHIPGKLWPVNDWALRSVHGLFTVNERIVTYIETEQGLVAVVMIGATNVGRIALHYMSLETNMRPWMVKMVRAFDHSNISVQAGAKIGTFKMGSSVIVVTESIRPRKVFNVIPCAVRFGETL